MRQKTGYPLFDKPFVGLLFITFLFLIYGGLVIDDRWIDVDEGAHLADAKLLLQGHLPYVDYLSRQPFYVMQLGLFVRLLGMHYSSGRNDPELITSLQKETCAGKSLLTDKSRACETFYRVTPGDP